MLSNLIVLGRIRLGFSAYFTELVTAAAGAVKSKGTNFLAIGSGEGDLNISLLFFNFLFFPLARLEDGVVDELQIADIIRDLGLGVLPQTSPVCYQHFVVLGCTVEQVDRQFVLMVHGRRGLLGGGEHCFGVGVLLG